MTLLRPLLIPILALLSLLCFARPGVAKNSAHAEPLALDEITVTAEKTEADAQDVAIPMSVLSKIDLEDREINAFEDLAGTVPNLQFLSSARPGGGSFNFRGLGMFGMSVISEKSPVVINFDGIPWEGRFSTIADFSAIERVEFLRGPQGTLYGKNAMGGVLNITTIQPGNTPEGKIGLTLAQNGTFGVSARNQGAVVNDKLFYFISGALDWTDGWFTDHTPGGEEDWDQKDSQQFLGKLIYTPTDRLSATLQYGIANVDAGNGPFIKSRTIVYDTTTGFTRPEFNTTSHNAALKVGYDMGGVVLTSVSTLTMTRTDSHQYFGHETSAGFDDIEEDVVTQEIRLASDRDPGEFNWLGGLFYSREHLDRKNTGYDYDLRSSGFGYISYDYPTVIDSDIYSVFGQVSLPVFSDKLTLTLGGRYEKVKRDMDHRYVESNALTGTINTASSYSIDDSWDSLMGKASLSYQWTKDLMLYTCVAQGYTPGGFNYLETDPDYAAFNEQKSIDYELGLKSMFWGNRLMINPNLFYTDYKDLQISEEVQSMKFVVVNAGQAHATGAELDFRARMTDSLDMYGGLGIIRTEYDDYKENMGSGAMDYSGNKMVNTPSYTLNLGTTYRNPGGFYASLDYQRYGETYFSTDNAEKFKRDAFHLVNGKIGWEFACGIDAYVYVTNALDEDYFTETVQEYGLYMVGQPRTFGMKLAYRF